MTVNVPSAFDAKTSPLAGSYPALSTPLPIGAVVTTRPAWWSETASTPPRQPLQGKVSCSCLGSGHLRSLLQRWMKRQKLNVGAFNFLIASQRFQQQNMTFDMNADACGLPMVLCDRDAL